MHDIRWIREHPQDFDAGLKARGLEPQSGAILAIDKALRAAQTNFQTAQARRNEVSKQIGQLKRQGQDASALMAEVETLKGTIASAVEEEKAKAAELEQLLAGIPNLRAQDVPHGADETGNTEVRRHGAPPAFAYKPKEHFELGERMGMMDFERAAKLSGSRFVVLSGGLARLERALANFMLDVHTREFGYTEISPPLLVRDTALFGTGQLPKFAEDQFQTTTGHWLVPTAEVPLTNLVADEILDQATLPRRYTAWTACFRAEAGAAGKDTRGMIRQHQFYKVELVSITHPDRSDEELERMTDCAEEILRRLGLHHRVMLLCSGDLGFSARKTYDLEVWLPGQNTFREISSCSNCGDFQARRMKARFRAAGEKGTRFLHTLNGSGVAIGRVLVAIMENYQQPDGSIAVPDALRSYMGGIGRIGA
ncbi:MAG: serine--tRNA ligase [Alphaproteobacteria bacterium]|nr:serine--tRNA ligase [Alphaproteobacteria bacterium]